MSNRFSFRTIVAATAYGCWIASTTTAFVTPSTRSTPSLLIPNIRVSPAPSRVSLEPLSGRPQELQLQLQPQQLANHAKAQWATAAAASSSSSSSLTADQKSILSVGLWCTLDICFRRLFQKLGIASKFPSSLGGCGVVLAVLLLLGSSSKDSQQESKLHRILTPGAGLLAKWLPVFFVPSLVTLPLVGSIESLGGSAEVRRKNCQ